jgi:tetratricopeptide (TPR) repeat protein
VGFYLLGALCIIALAHAASAQAPDPEQLFREAYEAQQRGDTTLAVGKYQQLIKLHPDIAAAHANLGVVLASLGRYDEAITEYHMALAEVPGDPALRLDLGLAYEKKDDFAGAAAQFAALHKEDPANLRFATLLGNCQVRLGLIGQALTLLEPLEKANPDNLDLEWALGMSLILSGQTREGLERVQKVADQGQNAEAYMAAADYYLGLTHFDKARHDAEAALRLNPHLPKAYVVLGIVDSYEEDWKGAEEGFEKALQLDPNDLQAQIELASVLTRERKLDAARRQIDRVLAQDPNLYSAWYLLARVERAQGHLEAAVKNFEIVEREKPEWLPPHVELAALYYLLKRPVDGAREKDIVDHLRAEEQQRRTRTQIISPEIALQ